MNFELRATLYLLVGLEYTKFENTLEMTAEYKLSPLVNGWRLHNIEGYRYGCHMVSCCSSHLKYKYRYIYIYIYEFILSDIDKEKFKMKVSILIGEDIHKKVK